MRRDVRITVIGAGQAAARSISTMRNAGFDGGITLIGEEPHLPYERPPLSKEALFSGADFQAPYVLEESFYVDNKVDLELGKRVEAIDAATGDVALESGEQIKSDRILIATGSRARTASIPGVEPERILSLRNIEDAKRLKPLLSAGTRVVLIGGGFIGLEIAAGAIRQGCEVTVVEARPRLIERAVSPQVSAYLQRLHTAQGVSFKLDSTIVAARQGAAETELLLNDGTSIVADVIIAGIGAVANSELAAAAGIGCSNGIIVNKDCRTSSEIVWAAGDVATRVHPWFKKHMRLESWESAENQAQIAGNSIVASLAGNGASVGQEEPPPWFWSDQYDLNLQILGCVCDSDTSVRRMSDDGEKGMIFHFRGNDLTGAELIGAGKERPLVKKLLQSGWNLPAEKLGDESMSLKELLAAAKAAAVV
ncbi:Ferredoxin reductase [Paraburkholderia caribensis MBA4]|uniref:Ferredoxin reductase n=1 Tax=Paraburkholderia caribensis MBA4 TaxID=1323664 RepID=A0A0P0RI74_9BURK|nr:FAD-dependent oxidoreductase [Paraburkholderia caribensis]ALL68475.1 Ferredoxin reductase [Paraburkholderia caribensis MBA4]